MRKFSSIQYLELSLTCFHVGCLDCGFPVNEVDTTNSTPHSQGTKESLETLEERKKTKPSESSKCCCVQSKPRSRECTRFLLSLLHSKLAVFSESLPGRTEWRLLSHFVISSLIFVLEEASPSLWEATEPEKKQRQLLRLSDTGYIFCDLSRNF